jgi:hypothetical protein
MALAGLVIFHFRAKGGLEPWHRRVLTQISDAGERRVFSAALRQQMLKSDDPLAKLLERFTVCFALAFRET